MDSMRSEMNQIKGQMERANWRLDIMKLRLDAFELRQANSQRYPSLPSYRGMSPYDRIQNDQSQRAPTEKFMRNSRRFNYL